MARILGEKPSECKEWRNRTYLPYECDNKINKNGHNDMLSQGAL